MAYIDEITEKMLAVVPLSAQEIFYMIQGEKQLSVSEIKAKINYSDRTVQQAIQYLKNLELIYKVVDMTDMRYHYYKVAD